MKIKRINLNEDVTSKYGLKPIQMDRLNNIVLIAGKNGAGKSRFLKLIKDQVQEYPIVAEIETAKANLLNYKKAIEDTKSIIETYRVQFKNKTIKDDKETAQYEIKLKQNNGHILLFENEINNANAKLQYIKNLNIEPEKIANSLVDFVPKSLTLTDSYTISASDLENSAKNIYRIGTDSINQGTIPAIDIIQKNWVNVNTSTIDDLNILPSEIEKINLDYLKLKKYIKLFLNTDLKRNKDGHPELFGKRIGEAQLSNGQKILLQFCMALFAQEISLSSLIILMDEPENHLHPAALIEVLDKIMPQVTNGQVWIATHSINILAHFDPSSIWYIDDGQISYAGNIPRKVLEGLIGNEEEITKLNHFMSLPAQMASDKFSYESLFYPDVLITGPEDSQIKQINKIIKDRTDKNSKLKVLDFGIGKGRLISTIFEEERANNNDISLWLDFYGYDKFETNKEYCNKILDEIYGNSINRYFNSPKDLFSKHDEKTFDIIVMCNVFHEIEPNEWLNLFNSKTSPFKLLKDTGFLLIVEDQFLAIGEKAHSKGFLVYDEIEFKKLFKIKTTDKYQSTDFRNDGRLKSHHIPKNCLFRIDAKSRKASLEILQQNSKDEIKKLRQQQPSFKNGKLHGFWSQQLANSILALEEL